MAHSTASAHGDARAALSARAMLGPLRAIDGAFQSIVSANRLARELNGLYDASDRKLRALGLQRSEIAQHVARNSEHFAAL